MRARQERAATAVRSARVERQGMEAQGGGGAFNGLGR